MQDTFVIENFNICFYNEYTKFYNFLSFKLFLW